MRDKRIIKIRIGGDIIATFKNGKWRCSVSRLARILNELTELGRMTIGYAPDREIAAALNAAWDMNAEVLQQPDGDELYVSERVY